MVSAPATLIGKSESLKGLDADISCSARSDAKVLITGESGVGKEIVARLIHARSRRSASPYLVINCAGVPETLLESELFGHEKGSFTGAHKDRSGRLELAHGGTVFLDEIGEMSLRMQGLLLRFLETGELQRVGGSHVARRVDVRVVAATNRCLEDEIVKGAFREDLYYRLNVIHLEVAPLRERPADIAPLAQHFLEIFAAQYGLVPTGFTADALSLLEQYHWPGNVRELRNSVERAVVRRPNERIGVDALPEEVLRQTRPVPAAAEGTSADSLYAQMAQGDGSFWSIVFAPFQSRDITRDDVREVLRRGLATSSGSYRGLLPLFNLEDRDYRSFMRAIRKHDCHLAFQQFRAERPKRSTVRVAAVAADGMGARL